MTAPSEQEWRDAIGQSLLDLLEVVEDDVEASEVRLTVDAVLAGVGPLRERERQQARQEAREACRSDLDKLRREVDERMRVNVGLIAENAELQRGTAATGAHH